MRYASLTERKPEWKLGPELLQLRFSVADKIVR